MKSIIFIMSILWYIGNTLINAQLTPAPVKYIEFIITPNSTDWTYQPGENASIRVLVLKNRIPLENIDITYETGPEMMPFTNRGSVKSAKEGVDINIGTSKIPGFIQCKTTVEIDGNTYSDFIKVGFAPSEIKPTVAFPDDFISYWEKAKMENSKIPMEVKITELPDYSTSKVTVSLIKIQNYKIGSFFYGYLCKPNKEGKFPVILVPPGAGIKSITPGITYAEQGFISLSTEIHGISPLLSAQQFEELSNAFGDYMYYRMDDKDNYYYKKVYLSCIRAIDFLCSLPEYDGTNVAVTGGSQGGALSIITAALDQRVKCIAAFYPALCDVTGYLHNQAGGWPNLFSSSSKDVYPSQDKLNTISYYDVVNFARQIKVPGYYSFGYKDNTCPPTSIYAAVNSIKAPKHIQIEQITGHWRFAETNQLSIDWIKRQLRINP